MTTWANPTPQIIGLRLALEGCAAFTSRSYVEAQIHYPKIADDAEAVVFPAFLLQQDGAREHRIVIVAKDDVQDVGLLEALAMELRDQLPSRYRVNPAGIVIDVEPDVSDVGEPSDGMIAAGDNLNCIEITCHTGLSLGG